MGFLSKRAPGVTRHGAWLGTVAAILVSFPFLRTDQPTLPRADMHDGMCQDERQKNKINSRAIRDISFVCSLFFPLSLIPLSQEKKSHMFHRRRYNRHCRPYQSSTTNTLSHGQLKKKRRESTAVVAASNPPQEKWTRHDR